MGGFPITSLIEADREAAQATSAPQSRPGWRAEGVSWDWVARDGDLCRFG
jgi:hypothetical protein